MNSDFEELLSHFNDSGVRYLVVGGYAVMVYTEPRYTKHLADDFAHPGFFSQIGMPPARVDILMSVDGITFEEAWPNRYGSHLGAQPAWFIGRSDLIRNNKGLRAPHRPARR